eukprot:CAMPEP_0116974140 /NCGR_PEP_ID=MMETSP0467-20121206/54964_1 /TAXON_ID=283647 /ORGANISM="Mesodinium pulex, Strain SPMC105" /LENGTH=153 /DNA_ID=CAMNT_0004666173 /DNA_START=301 /DNA_END=762 /DNA_ORIENTATION=-
MAHAEAGSPEGHEGQLAATLDEPHVKSSAEEKATESPESPTVPRTVPAKSILATEATPTIKTTAERLESMEATRKTASTRDTSVHPTDPTDPTDPATTRPLALTTASTKTESIEKKGTREDPSEEHALQELSEADSEVGESNELRIFITSLSR